MSSGRNLGRAAAWPLRRALDPRFADVGRRVSDGTSASVAASEAAQGEVRALRAEVGALRADLDAHVAGLLDLAALIGERLDRLDDTVEGAREETEALRRAVQAMTPQGDA